MKQNQHDLFCSSLNPEHALSVSARQVSDRKGKTERVGARKIVIQLLLSNCHSKLQLSILSALGSLGNHEIQNQKYVGYHFVQLAIPKLCYRSKTTGSQSSQRSILS